MPRSKKLNVQMREESQKKILRTARKLFAEQGYFHCKVSDIAKAADMSQGNVYWYFSGKEDLLKAILKDGFNAVEIMLTSVAAFTGSSVDKLDALFDESIALYDQQQHFMRLLVSLMLHSGTKGVEGLGFDLPQIGAIFHAALRPVFAEAVQEGILEKADPDQLVMLYFSIFNGLLLTYGENWDLLAKEQLYRSTMGMLGKKL